MVHMVICRGPNMGCGWRWSRLPTTKWGSLTLYSIGSNCWIWGDWQICMNTTMDLLVLLSCTPAQLHLYILIWVSYNYFKNWLHVKECYVCENFICSKFEKPKALGMRLTIWAWLQEEDKNHFAFENSRAWLSRSVSKRRWLLLIGQSQ